MHNNLIGGKGPIQSKPGKFNGKSVKPSSSVHLRTSKSRTLHKAIRLASVDSFVKPTAKVEPKPKNIVHSIDTSNKSSEVKRFNVKNEFTFAEEKPKQTQPVSDKLTHRDKKDHLTTQALNSAKTSPHRLLRNFKLPRLSTIATSAAAAVLLLGYITYLNIPNISLRVAASRAGIDASLPEYSPPGFDFDGPVAYSTGEISVKYQSSNNNSQSYTLVQKKSNWDSQSLLTNHVEAESNEFETHESNGLTIYTLGESAATWVNGGIWYTINDNAELSSEQLIDIATSI